MIPKLISRSPLSYRWDSYSSVEVFSSKSAISEYRAVFEKLNFFIDPVQDSELCLQYNLIGRANSPVKFPVTFEVLAVDTSSEEDVWDLESYIGEDEFHQVAHSDTSSIGVLFKREKPNVICDECGSQFLSETSEMDALCPECAHQLYSYPNCSHEFNEAGKCVICEWDGSVSEYLKNRKNEN